MSSDEDDEFKPQRIGGDSDSGDDGDLGAPGSFSRRGRKRRRCSMSVASGMVC